MKRGIARDDFDAPPDDMAASDHDSDSSWEDVGASDSPASKKCARKSTGGIWIPRLHDRKAEDFEDGFVQSHPNTPRVVKEYEMYPPQSAVADAKAQNLEDFELDHSSAPTHTKNGGSAAEKSAEALSDTATSTTTDSAKSTAESLRLAREALKQARLDSDQQVLQAAEKMRMNISILNYIMLGLVGLVGCLGFALLAPEIGTGTYIQLCLIFCLTTGSLSGYWLPEFLSEAPTELENGKQDEIESVGKKNNDIGPADKMDTSTTESTYRPEKITFTAMQKVCGFVFLFLAMQINLDVLEQYYGASDAWIQFLMTLFGVLCLSGVIFVPLVTLIDWLDSQEGANSGPLLHTLTKSLVAAFSCGAVTPRLFPGNIFLGVSDWQKNQPPDSWWMQAHDLGLLFSFRAFALVMVIGVAIPVAKVLDAYVEDDDDIIRTDEELNVLASVRDELRGYGKKISNLAGYIWNSGILGLICKLLLAYLVLYSTFGSLGRWTAFQHAWQRQGIAMESLSNVTDSLNVTQGSLSVPAIDCKAHPEGLPCELVSSLASPGRVDCENTHKGLKFNCVGVGGWLRRNGAPDLVLVNREYSCGKLMIPCPPIEKGGCMGQIAPSTAAESPRIVTKSPNTPSYDIQQPCVRHGGDTFPGTVIQEPQSKSGAENPSQPKKASDSQPQEDHIPGVIDCKEYPEGFPCELVSKWARPGAMDCSKLPEDLKFPCAKTAKWLWDDRAKHPVDDEDAFWTGRLSKMATPSELYHRAEQGWGCKLISNGRGGWTSER